MLAMSNLSSNSSSASSSDEPPSASGPVASTPITRAVLEIDEYASGLGWDQPARLFALVDTARLRADEPELAASSVSTKAPHPPRSPLSSRTRSLRTPRSTSSSPRSPGPARWRAARSRWSA